MKALVDFFTTDYGLLSAAVLVVTVGMVGFFVRFFVSHMREDEAKQRQLQGH